MACVLAAAGPLHAAAAFDCLIEPSQTVEIRSPVEGLIERIAVQRGDTVRRGQVLVELRSEVERSAVESARLRASMDGRIEAARHRLEFANRKLARVGEMVAARHMAEQARDEAEAEQRLASAELREAEEARQLARAELRQASELLALRTLASPVDGIVVDRQAQVGEVAEAGAGRKPVLRLAQLDPLRVEVVLPVALAGRVRPGSTAQVQPEGAAQRLTATVKVVDRVYDAASGTFGVRLELPNRGGGIAGGQRCRVEFPGLAASAAAPR